MEFSISPYDSHVNHLMKPWPNLTSMAKLASKEKLASKNRDGETIFYYDCPPNGASVTGTVPVVVLIHGLGDEADSWRHLIPLLNSGGYRVLAPDLPGFGRSVAAGKISLKNHASAVLRLLEAQETAALGPVFLAGNSLGALVAEAAAFEMQSQASPPARALILIDGSMPGGPSNPGILALAKLLLCRKWYRAYQDNPNKAWKSLYLYYANLDSMPQEDKEFLRDRVMNRVESRTQEKAFFRTQRSLIWAFMAASSSFAKKIQSYRGKILLLWGDMDRIIPLSSTETFMALRGDIEMKIIKGAGHLPQQEKPEDTARLMLEFMDRVVD